MNMGQQATVSRQRAEFFTARCFQSSVRSVQGRAGMTLIELLVVLVIVGILSAVSLRAMDATRERSNFDKTMRTMQQLSNAISGDSKLVSEGRRTDFGFVGDMGRYPEDLDELRVNETNSPAWHGPYVRIPFQADLESFKSDAWGQELQYPPGQAKLMSLADGKNPLTYVLAQDTSLVFDDSVIGTIADNQGNPPGDLAPTMSVRIVVTDPETGQPLPYQVTPDRDGTFRFGAPLQRIPMGNHEVTVIWGGQSLTKWVSVNPRVGSVVDFRWGGAFAGALKLVNGSVAWFPGSPGPGPDLWFDVINTGGRTVTVDSLTFMMLPTDSAYTNEVWMAGQQVWGPSAQFAGDQDTIAFGVPVSVESLATARLEMKDFCTDSTGSVGRATMSGVNMKLKFSDGSYLDFQVP